VGAAQPIGGAALEAVGRDAIVQRLEMRLGLGRLLQVVIGKAALFVSLILFVFLNIPSLGATYTDTMLSPFWRFLNHFWIGAQTVNAERSILYFDGQNVGPDVLKMLAWTAALLAILAADLCGLSKAEVERIWLPFAAWLPAGAALLPPPARRFWLLVQAAVALLVNHLLLTTW